MRQNRTLNKRPRASAPPAPVRAVPPSPQTGQRGEVTDAAYQSLYEMAHDLGPTAKMPPLRRLREQFGVSQATLDAALDRLERQNILLRRERSGVYVASNLRQRNIVLLFAPDFFVTYGASPFWAQLVQQFRERARDADIHLTVSFALPRFDGSAPVEEPQDSSLIPPALQEDIRAGTVHGVLAVGLPHPTARWIEARGIPVVAFAGAAQYIITFALNTLVQMGLNALIRQGCRRIALWRMPDPHYCCGYAQFIDSVFVGGLVAQGITPDANGGISFIEAPSNVEMGWEMALRQFGPKSDPEQRPDGIISMDDMISQGGLMAFYRFGIEVGKGLRMVTYTNKGATVLRAWEDRLWRVEYDVSRLVDLLFETLTCLIDAPGSVPAHLTFDLPEGFAAPLTERYQLIQPRLIPPTHFEAPDTPYPTP